MPDVTMKDVMVGDNVTYQAGLSTITGEIVEKRYSNLDPRRNLVSVKLLCGAIVHLYPRPANAVTLNTMGKQHRVRAIVDKIGASYIGVSSTYLYVYGEKLEEKDFYNMIGWGMI